MNNDKTLMNNDFINFIIGMGPLGQLETQFTQEDHLF